MAQTIGIKMEMDGAAQFKADLQQITQRSKELAEEMKAVASGTDDTAEKQRVLNAQIDNAKQKVDLLNQKYSAQEKALKASNEELEKAKKEYGDDSEEVQKLNLQITKQETALSKTKTEINKSTTELNKLESQTDETGKEMKELGDATEDAGKEAKNGNEGFTVLKGTIANLAADAIKAAVQGLKNLADGIKESISNAAELGDEVDKSSQKLGISAENYQKLSYAMERSGADVESFKKGMINMNSALAEFAEGGENAGAEYAALGVSMTKADGSIKNAEELLLDTVDALANMEDETQRDAAAQKIFGKSMTELRPLLNNGSEGIKALMNEAEEYGMVMSNDAVKASVNYKDSLTKLNGTVEGVKTRMVSEFLPALTDVADGFSKMIAGVDGGSEDLNKGIQGLISGFTNKIPEFINVGKEILLSIVGGIADNAGELITAVTGIIPELFNAFADIVTSIDLGALISAVFDAANNIIKGILPRLPELLIQLVGGIIEALPELFIGVGETIATIFDSLFGGYTEFDKFSEKVEAQSDAWHNVTGAMQTATDQANNDAVTWSNSWEMLKNITDSAGNVKQGYEGMAQALTEQLNGALGTNITIIDGQIQDYQTLCQEIDNLIEKKRAELILQAEEEAYAEALRQRPELLAAAAEAEANYTAAQEELNAAQAEYNGLVESGGDLTFATQRLDEARLAVSNMSKALDEATANVEENTRVQSQYMDDYTKVMKGDYNELGRVSKKYTGDTARDLIAHRKTIEQQLDQDQQNYDAWVKDYQNSLSEHSKAQVDYYARRIAEDKTQIANINGLIKQGGKDFTQGYINGILENESQVTEAGNSVTNKAITAVQNTQQSQSPAKVTQGLGNDFSEGYKLGIEEKGEAVKTSAEGVAGKAVTGISSKEGEAKTAGAGIGSNFVAGLDSKAGEATASGSEAGGNYASGITSKEGTAQSAGQGLAGSAKEGAASENGSYSGYGFYGVGEYAGDGFAAGISSKEYKVTTAAKTLANKAKWAMEQGLDIGSPSKVTRELGRFFGEGFSLGITDEVKEATLAAADLANSATGALNDNYLSPTSALMESNIARMAPARAFDIDVIVNGTEGMNENVLADLVINKLQMELIGSEAVYA